MSERFYVNCPLSPGPVLLHGPEAHHLATVCRLRPGDRVYLFNGDGQEYPAEVTAIARQQVGLQVLIGESPRRELDFRLEVAAPLPRGDRGQFLLEKLTELGVTSFVPLRTCRSVVHPGDGRLEKLQRYVIEASKQCGRNVLLRIEPMAEWSVFCRGETLPRIRIVAHPGGVALPKGMSKDRVVAVGPEGGFTDEEIEVARSHGWQGIDLGPRILRIETAALVLAAWGGTILQP